jgi:drug/metabolite transporter (DMT)-like permease
LLCTGQQEIMRSKGHFIPVLSLLGAMVLWASSFIALKLAFTAYDPMVVIFGRMFAASIIFVFVAPFFKGNSLRREDLKLIAFMVICEPCLYFLFEAAAIKNTSASQAGMITAMLPLMVAVAAGMYLKERITGRTITGFLMAIAGAGLLSLVAKVDGSAPNPVLGNFYEFLAMVFATGYTISLKRLSSRYSPFFLTALQSFAGSFFYLPFLFLPLTTMPTGFYAVPALSVLYLGIFVSIGAYGLYNYAVSKVPASQASAFVNLIPVFTVIFGRIILDERFTPFQYVASAIVIAGVFISQDWSNGKNSV